MLRNTEKGYGLGTILFHWVIALMFVGQGTLGFIMNDLAVVDPARAPAYRWHQYIGLTILALALLRLAWRTANRQPALPAAMPAWEKRVARLSHFALLAGLVLVPLAGWLAVSASPLNVPAPADIIVAVPRLPIAAGETAEAIWGSVHENLAKIVMAVALLHIAAALRHEFILRDGLLSRMIRPVRE